MPGSLLSLFWLSGALVEYAVRWPECLPHPVRLIGLLLNRLENLGRGMYNQRIGGLACLIVALLVVGCVVKALLLLPGIGAAAGFFLVFAGLALGELIHACRGALQAVERSETDGELDDARRQVGMLVSRDTSAMQPDALRRALAETVSENFNDAFAAPLFWLLLGGPVGLWLYKTVSTMDSMWGYTHSHWKDLGMAGARCDDALAWIPARVSALALYLAAPFSPHFGQWPGWRTVRAQAAAMASPNAGWPMTTAAWLHGAAMGGPTPYCGTIVDKPALGPHTQDSWSNARLHALFRHIQNAGLLLFLCVVFIAYAMQGL